MNADEIIKQLEDVIEQKIPMSPSYWLDQSEKLAVIWGDETDKLFKLKKEVAMAKVAWLNQGKSSVEAKTRVEATDLYEQMEIQRSKIEQIKEIIRIAKLQSKMRQDEFQNQF